MEQHPNLVVLAKEKRFYSLDLWHCTLKQWQEIVIFMEQNPGRCDVYRLLQDSPYHEPLFALLDSPD